ncbi:MAG: RagB/SusD family nutrient uptake outer membrane protein [Bacteroidales bacterium]|jgi:hypothetical protein|nr:RagB/SusD family nutrient uptake outer membrane protein [Bacteroidales bacterium]
MKNIKSIFGLIFIAVNVFIAGSCKDFLNVDKYFDDEVKVDSIFQSKRYVEAYMWGAATLFKDEGQLLSNSTSQGTPGPLATDEVMTMCNLGRGSYNGMRFVQGMITAEDVYPFDDVWNKMYQIIRKCNLIITRIDEVPDLTTIDRFEILGLTRFYRAYAYYKLLIDFGPPVLLGDEIVENNETMEYYDRSRSTYDEAVEYICGEFEEAAKYLPSTVSLINFERPTKGAAFALTARLRLIHASPLFNGGDLARNYYSSWTRKSDGAYYVAQEPDERRWAIAAAAAKRVMDMEDPRYRLYTVDSTALTPALPAGVADPDYYKPFPEGAGKIDHFKSYSENFTGECVAGINPEFIWACKTPQLKNYMFWFFPNSIGSSMGCGVNQKMVDAYYMRDGRTIQNPSAAYPYDEVNFTTKVTNFSGYKLNAGVNNMYANREMRFYANIGFSECFWTCSSTSSQYMYDQTITYYYSSDDGKSKAPSAVDWTPTGYVCRKFVHPIDAIRGTNARLMDKVFPIIRYAEILLSYAEALNNIPDSRSYEVEVDGQMQTFTRNTEEIKRAFNQVRYRAGLPGLTPDELAGRQQIQALIEKERMIEFFFENRRYYDVRRWEKYEREENVRFTGMNVEADKSNYYMRVVPNTSRVTNRVVHRKMIFLPIPLSEIRRLPSFDQNPGW